MTGGPCGPRSITAPEVNSCDAARARKPASHGWTGTRMRPRGAGSPRSRAASRGADVPVALSCTTRSASTDSQCSGKCGWSSGANGASRPLRPLRRGVQRVAEHERLVGLDERERLGREQAVQVRRARLDVRADAVDARVHPVQQRLRRGARVQLLADPARELGRRDADRPEPVVQRVRAVQQLRLHAELGEDRAILPERRTPALTQKAVQQRRCGRQCSGILARRSKQPAES